MRTGKSNSGNLWDFENITIFDGIAEYDSFNSWNEFQSNWSNFFQLGWQVIGFYWNHEEVFNSISIYWVDSECKIRRIHCVVSVDEEPQIATFLRNHWLKLKDAWKPLSLEDS